MKCTHLLGTAVVVAVTLFVGTPSFAKGGGGHGGHGGGHAAHGGHGGHASHGGHAHTSNHSFAHHSGTTGHSGHQFGNHSFAHSYAGYHHNGYAHGWGYGGHGWGWNRGGWYGRRGWGPGYWGGWGGGYVGGTVGPSYYYSNPYTYDTSTVAYPSTASLPVAVDAPLFPPVTQTVVPSNVTEVIDPATALVPPAPADSSAVVSQGPVDDATTAAPAAEPTTPIAG